MNELSAMSLIKGIKQAHDMTVSKVEEGFEWSDKCGELLIQAKEVIRADKSTTFGAWIDQFLPFSERTAQSYMKLHRDLGKLPKAQRSALFREAGSISALQRMLNPSPIEDKRDTATEPRQNLLSPGDYIEEPVTYELPESPVTPEDDPETDETLEDDEVQEEGEQEPDPADLAKKAKQLAHSYRDKLARAICDYHEHVKNRAERDRLVKLVQGVKLW